MEKIKNCTGFIEATDYEKFCIWNEFKEKEKWVEDNNGILIKVGLIDNDKNKPVFVSFFFAKINDKNVGFYNTTSRFNDSKMVENWIKKQNKKAQFTDATNSHIILQ